MPEFLFTFTILVLCAFSQTFYCNRENSSVVLIVSLWSFTPAHQFFMTSSADALFFSYFCVRTCRLPSCRWHSGNPTASQNKLEPTALQICRTILHSLKAQAFWRGLCACEFYENISARNGFTGYCEEFKLERSLPIMMDVIDFSAPFVPLSLALFLSA